MKSNKTKKTDIKKRYELSTSAISHHVTEEQSRQTAEGVTSLRDFPLELRKEQASKPLYLTRYE